MRAEIDAFEERAAIMEHDGGMTRDEAERRAAVERGFRGLPLFLAELLHHREDQGND